MPIVLRMELVDFFVMGEAVGIVATLLVSFYYSRKQMQKLSLDIETKFLNDMDERMHELTRMGVERPELIRVINKCKDISLQMWHMLTIYCIPSRIFFTCVKEER